MRLSDFDYTLPKKKIALFPTRERADAKLLCVGRRNEAVTHRVFRDLSDFLRPTDVLVLNNTKVLPARLFGKKATGGKVEALLLKDLGNNVWESLLKSGGRIKEGDRIAFSKNTLENTGCLESSLTPGVKKGNDELVGTVVDSQTPDSGKRCILFEGEDVSKKLHALGHVPLPPYIDRPDIAVDRETYQTVYAEKEGAVASPTAGLHFDKGLLERISGMGVEIVPVTLHVSYGTFQPIAVENIDEHVMFEEEYEITEDSAAKINKAKKEGRRIVVCGTTCVRALESAAIPTEPGTLQQSPGLCRGAIRPGQRTTDIFIHPPHDFKVVDAMITNFHMPKSTLLVMIAAFLGYDKMMAAYQIALKENYRFASYGDAMLIS